MSENGLLVDLESTLNVSTWPIRDWIYLYLPEPWMQGLAGIAFLLLLFVILRLVTQAALSTVVGQALLRMGKKDWLELLVQHRIKYSVATAIPLFIVATGLSLIPMSQEALQAAFRLVLALGFLYIVKATSGLLLCWQDYKDRTQAQSAASIKGYIQVARIVLWSFGLILIISVLMGKSPMLMLSGIGALSAVLLLVFKDTLLSVVASSQLNSNDMLRVGDWIEMPQAGADGFVIDIALHTVKVQNWDKTVTTIPTYQLFSSSYKNWRHMFESGGRRIKRSLRIDASTVRFLSSEDIERLKRFVLLDDYLEEKQKDIEAFNAEIQAEGEDPSINGRRLTNIGTFRAYANAYIKQKKGVHPDMIMMVRMMEPTAEGIPMEVYCFSQDTAWVHYEALQGDIFDHLLSILPEMGLRLYQAPAGSDLREGLGPQNRDLHSTKEILHDA